MRRLLDWAAVVYALLLVAWLVLRLALGDGAWWLLIANLLALYLFLPLPAIVLWALRRRQARIWLAAAAPLAAFAVLFGTLLVPKASLAEATRTAGGTTDPA